MSTFSAAKRLELASRLLDAASCITIIRQPRATARGYAYRLALLVRRTREAELQEMVEAFGLAGSIAAITTRGAPSFQLSWYGQAAVDVLAAARPWLRKRAKEARLAVRFWEQGGMAGTHGPAPDDVWDKRDRFYVAMRELKAELAGRERTISPHRDLSLL